MKIIYNKVEYEVLQKNSDSIIYTDGFYLYQIDPKTGIALYNTGKSKADLYRLASAFNPKTLTMPADFIAILQQSQNSLMGKAFIYGNKPDCFVYIFPKNTHSDPYYDGIYVEKNNYFKDHFNKTNLISEISFKIFATALKEAMIKALFIDEDFSSKFFKENY